MNDQELSGQPKARRSALNGHRILLDEGGQLLEHARELWKELLEDMAPSSAALNEFPDIELFA